MPTLDPYSITDQLDETAITSITNRLESRGRDPFFRKMLEEYLEALDPGRLSRVLEVGCGTGVATRTLAGHPEFSGHIDASDLSGELVAAAKKLAEEAGCADRITFSVGDALALKDVAPYDAVIAHTVVSHVPRYDSFLSAMRRATAAHGRAVIFDGDYASITFGSDDPADGEAMAQAIIAGMITNPTIMRQMPHLAAAAGFGIERSFSYLLSEIGSARFFADMFPSLPVLLPKTGVADEETVRAWVDRQTSYSESGRFFGAINFYTYILRPRNEA